MQARESPAEPRKEEFNFEKKNGLQIQSFRPLTCLRGHQPIPEQRGLLRPMACGVRDRQFFFSTRAE